MMEIAQSTDKNDADIISSAQFNLGRAYFMVNYKSKQQYKFHPIKFFLPPKN